MDKYKCIIIDDEFPSQIAISKQLKKIPNITCIATFDNPVEALSFLQVNQIDLIFLDIEMPRMNGFQFLETLKQDIFVVLLTAYESKYGLEAHKYFYDENLIIFTNKAQVSFYLPKIIDKFERVHRERKIIHRISKLSKNETHTFPKKINNQTILFSDIRIIKVVGHYIALMMKNNEEHIFRMSLKELLIFLPEKLFFRIKRNTIINIIYVTALNETTVSLDNDHFIVSLKFNPEIISDLKSAIRFLRR